MDYIFTNFGQIVYADKNGTIEKGVITGIEEENVKVYFETGGFNYINRDELEKSMIAKESVAIDTTPKE